MLWEANFRSRLGGAAVVVASESTRQRIHIKGRNKMGKSKKSTDESTQKKTRKPRVSKNPLDTMAATVTRAIATSKRYEKAVAKLSTVDARLRTFEGCALPETADENDLLVELARLKADGFVVKGRAAKVAAVFENGAKVKIKADKISKYATFYQPAELESMVYDFFDDVNKRHMVNTDFRVMAVSKRDLEAR